MNPITNKFIDPAAKEYIDQVCNAFEDQLLPHLNLSKKLSSYSYQTKKQVQHDKDKKYLVSPRYASKILDIPDLTVDQINNSTIIQVSLTMISILNSMIDDLNGASESETANYTKRLESALYNYTALYNALTKTVSSWAFFNQQDMEYLLERKFRIGIES